MADHNKTIMEAADALCAALWPEVEALTAAKGKAALPALLTLSKPYLRSALARVEGVDVAPDGRTAVYAVSAMFWELGDDGQENEAELIASTDDDGMSCEVRGLQAALEKLALWIAELHDGEELSESAYMQAVSGRVSTLRVAINRGEGTGAFRVHYEADGVPHLAHATVSRVPDEEETDDG